MGKRLLWVVFCVLSLLACQLPSVCDTIDTDCRLCDISRRAGVPLEVIGAGLIEVNDVAIAKNLYTRKQAIEALGTLRQVLREPSITYYAYRRLIYRYIDGHPGLLRISRLYIQQLGSDGIIYKADREILDTWLTEEIGRQRSLL